MKFYKVLRGLNIFFSFVLITANIIFGFYYRAGFYYLRYILAFWGYGTIILSIMQKLFFSKVERMQELENNTSEDYEIEFFSDEDENSSSDLKEHILKIVQDDIFDEAVICKEHNITDEDSDILAEDSGEQDFDGFFNNNTRKYTPVDEYRKFKDVFALICENLPENKAKELLRVANYWPPEIEWQNLADYVNENVVKDSSNIQSVRVYAILCNKSERKIRLSFLKMGK